MYIPCINPDIFPVVLPRVIPEISVTLRSSDFGTSRRFMSQSRKSPRLFELAFFLQTVGCHRRYPTMAEAIMDLLANDIMHLESLIQRDEDVLAAALEDNADRPSDAELALTSHDLEVIERALNFNQQTTPATPPPEPCNAVRVDHSDTSVTSVVTNAGAAGTSKPASEKRVFAEVSEADTAEFVRANQNRNTAYKTRSDVKIFREWLGRIGDFRQLENIQPSQLNMLLARFFLVAHRQSGEDYEPDTLTSIVNSVDRHLRQENYGHCLKTDAVFAHSRQVLASKRKQLKSTGLGNKKRRSEPLTSEDVQLLYIKGVLGEGNFIKL
jgi:hypothetical protein